MAGSSTFIPLSPKGRGNFFFSSPFGEREQIKYKVIARSNPPEAGDDEAILTFKGLLRPTFGGTRNDRE
jgi:hypothetical protein